MRTDKKQGQTRISRLPEFKPANQFVIILEIRVSHLCICVQLWLFNS